MSIDMGALALLLTFTVETRTHHGDPGYRDFVGELATAIILGEMDEARWAGLLDTLRSL